MKKYMIFAAFLINTTLVLSACGPAIIAGAATGATMLHDRRTSATIMEDKAIAFKAGDMMRKHPELADNSSIKVVAYNKNLLIIGQARDQQTSNAIEQLMTQVDEVKKVYNELTLGEPTGITTASKDSWITTKIKTASLNGRRGVDPLHVKVTTKDGVVYLMGIVSRKEADQATELARQTEGVQRVVRVFEYTD